MTIRHSLSPPDVVNEIAARAVAAQVALVAGTALAWNLPWLAVGLACDFAVRALAYPRLSPLAQLTKRVWLPAMGRPNRPTPAAPKRFAQSIGFVVSTVAVAAWLPLGHDVIGRAILGMLLAFAILESALAFCAGCWLFAQLVRAGLLPAAVCVTCVGAEATTPAAR